MITSFFKPKRSRNDHNDDNATGSGDKESESENYHEDLQKNKKLKAMTAPVNMNKSRLTADKSPQVLELIAHLKDDPHPEQNNADVSLSWKVALDKHFSAPSFRRLASFVESQRKSHTVFPPPQDTFSALDWTPLDRVKVVIVGQDPYHGPNQAHGLCFSVRRGVSIPPSLRNIYKELVNDPKIENFTAMPNHGYLERWAKQGVLMINTVLTVRQGDANSHQKKGWEEFTDEIIRAVDRRCKQSKDEGDSCDRKRGVVFLLWGKPATNKTKTALAGSGTSRHTIICTSHPSPLGATKTHSPFLGSRCFSRANEALRNMGYDEVDWRVDGPLP